MNPDEATSPTSPSVSTSTGRRIRVRPAKRASISQEASLPSIPSLPSLPADDNNDDWVSPFTLPPLPAFKKLRSQVDRSPDDKIHNRSGSSAYYAAAWGSPYATPSPNQSPALRVNRNRSLDLESSPLASRKSTVDQSGSRHSRQNSLPTLDPIRSTDLPSSPSPIDSQEDKSQRRNWLSESEDSGSDAEKQLGKTPTQHKLVSSVQSRLHSHHVQASVDTITPETFNGTSSLDRNTEAHTDLSNMADTQAESPLLADEKPLPNIPRELDAMAKKNQPESRPTLPPPIQSFNRPKKKVPWKGKSCIISMPSTDREQAGLPPVLSVQEKQQRLQKWLDLGYPIHGFSIENWNSPMHISGGASRPTFPDQTDIDIDRKSNQTRVRIPDPAEWKAWQDYLIEEKLRSLGVSASNSEAPASTMSPFSSTMSRVSSTYPSVAPSPPMPSVSATGMRPHMSHSPYSPSISHLPGVGFTPLSQRGTPALPNGRAMHGYTQSIAIPGMGQRIGSPFDYPISQPGVYGAGVRSPDSQLPGRRAWTPGHVQNMQSMANLYSPTIQSPLDLNRGFSSNPQVQAMLRQQEALARQQQHVQAQIVNHHQRQMSMFPMRAMSAEQVHQLPLTPKAVSPAREPPEIMHPTPRSHRHNLSAALEKGVTESVAASTKQLNNAVETTEKRIEPTEPTEPETEELEDGEIEEEEKEQEELPILQRPETIKDEDDKAEIETNPSIAGTPMLLDEKNPFATFQPLPPPKPLADRTGFGHAAQPSLSKLNVQAKEFSPSKPAPNPGASVFNFDGNAFASQASSPGKSAVSGPRFGHKHNPSSLGLNVTAQVFTPFTTAQPAQAEPKSLNGTNRLSNGSFTQFGSGNAGFLEGKEETAGELAKVKTDFDPRSSAFSFTAGNDSSAVTPAKSTFDPKSSTFSTFSFGSTSFNVDAPEFKPSGLSLSSIDFTPEKPTNFTGTIFGDVTIDPASRPERRPKTIPIVRPNSREGSASPKPQTTEEPQENFGADGRAVAPSDRNKRAKKISAEDEEILFADSAPFKSLANEDVKSDIEVSANGPAKLAEPEESAPEEVKSPATPKIPEEIVADAEAEKKQTSPAEELNEPETANVEKPPSEAAEVEVKDQEKESVSQTEDITQDALVEPVSDKKEEIINKEAEPAGLVTSSTVAEGEQPGLDTSNAEVAVETTTEPVAEPVADNSPDAAAEAVVQPAERSDEAVEADSADKAPEEPEIQEDDMQLTEKPAVQAPALSAEASTFQPTLSAKAPVFQPTQPADSNPQPGLSALAPSFEFKPTVQEFMPTPKQAAQPVDADETKPKKAGLMASKFAASPSPAPEEPVAIESKYPQTLPENLDDQVLEQERNVQTEPIVPSLAIPKEDEKDENGSQEGILDALEKYREHDSRSGSVVSRTGDLSYEEINAVMKQFEDNPDLGVIREDTPVNSTPLIDMGYPQQFRSDAPSPSPNRRLNKPFNADRRRPYGGLGFEISGVHQLNYGGSGEINDWNADFSPGQQDKLESRAHFFDDHVNDLVDNVLESRLAPLERALQNIQNSVQQVSGKPRHSRRSMSTENKDSDADDEDEYDAYEGYAHYRSRSPKRRDRRQEQVKTAVLEAMALAQSNTAAPQFDASLLESTLEEMRELAEKAAAQPQQPPVDLTSIQEALAELRTFGQREPKVPEVDTSELTRTVAEMKLLVQQRAAEPQIDVEAMRLTLDEIRQLAAEKPIIPDVDLSAIQTGLTDLRSQLEAKPREEPRDMKTVLEEVISSHPRFTELREVRDEGAMQKLKDQIKDLEAMLKVAEKRADGEASLRREAEEENDSFHRHLKDAQDQATVHREASQQAQKSIQDLQQEAQSYRAVSSEVQALRLKNEALEKTLDEYRDFKEKIKDELEIERGRTDSLARALQDARLQHRDQTESRDVLRVQLSRVQERINTVMQDVRHDEAEWRKREHDLLGKNQLLQSALDHETNRRARMELETEKLTKEHRESLQFRSRHDTAQEEVSRLAAIIVGLQTENKKHSDAAHHAQRELTFLTEKQDETIALRTHRLQDELDAARSSFHNLQSDADARIARLQGQLDVAAVELQESKAKHSSNMEKMFENHNNAIRKVEERHAADLEQRLALHEEKLVDLRKQHSRDVGNASEDRKALEHRYTEKLELSNDKVQHLEGKIRDLEERLEVSKDAARAAVIAAAKSVNLPTPASSVVASPPHRGSISSASMPLAKGSELPEKISPQALRETIMVLQDQLQNREQKIDKLEAELAAIDKDAPARVKERDTEIVMLRELLEVRIDDLQELIATLEKPEYNRVAVKDAVIRLKTQIKMEQQLKERAITGANLAGNLPSSITSGLANLTQSPRAMVAAAAWGNWRKVRDSGVGSAVTDFASNLGSQTPSRSSSASSSLLAGIMTPPTATQSSNENSKPSTARPLAAAATARRTGGPGSPASGARPLRAFNSQPRTLSGSRPLGRRGTNELRPGSSGSLIPEPTSMRVEPPSTPLQMATGSDFGDDVDEDASPLDGKDRGFGAELIDEPAKPQVQATKIVSPRRSRTSSGKPVSPRALRALAGISRENHAEVIEED